ncbi:MAG: hypothetical protein JNJ73_10655 [Hyphomonadaceae bacterium]|nr:hypothetical protein [Hyphomonadaceae bacterium]
MRTSSTLGLAAGLASAVLFWSNAVAQTGEASGEVAPICPSPTARDRHEGARVRAALQQHRSSWGAIAFGQVRGCALRLQASYQRQAERRQRRIDHGSGVTFVGALGAGLSGPAGVNTQHIWLGGALLPVLVLDYSAHEPIRDLYHAGASAFQLVTTRYEQVQALAQTVDATAGAAAPVEPPGCARVEVHVATLTSWTKDDDRDALLPEAQRLLADCQKLTQTVRETNLLVQSARALGDLSTQRYATDILALDQLIIARSRDLRFTPFETISNIVVSPLRTLDAFLTGDGAKAAVDKLRSAVTFEAMKLDLQPINLPQLPGQLTPTAPASAAARARLGVRRTEENQRRGELVAAILIDLDKVAGDLAMAQRQQAYRHALLSDLRTAAAYTELTFNYSATSGIVTVKLAPPSPPSPPAPTATSPPAQ